MALKIYLSPSSQVHNAYAAQGTNEQRQCNRIAEAAKVALERNGYIVKKAPEGQSYKQNAQESNAWGADIHMPIHTNAGGSSKGTLALCYSGNTGNKYVLQVYNAVAALTPWADSGIRVRSDLYEINATKATCVYVEMAFHDKSDSAQWIIDNVVPLGEAIAQGMCAADGKTYIAGDGTQVVPPMNAETSSSGSGQIKVDGYWGPNTTTLAQKVFGTEVDGVVSNQHEEYKSKNPGLEDGWDWQDNPSGYSPLIKAIQKWCGAKQDGHIGPKTISAMQSILGCAVVDGYFSKKSPAIKAFQTWLNQQAA